MLGFGPLGSSPLGATPSFWTPVEARLEILLQVEIIHSGTVTAEGALIKAVAYPWRRIVDWVTRDPGSLAHFAQNPRAFEEFIAASYDQAGFDEVTLTPQRGDGGRDVIAVKNGFGSVRFLEQTKAYSPGHLVTHDDIRAMLGVLSVDRNSSKGLITTTSDFQPGITKSGSEFSSFLPHRLELKNGNALRSWLRDLADSVERENR
jgi:restriction system protein